MQAARGPYAECREGLVVDLLAAFEHGDELAQAALARLRLFCLLEAVGDRVAVGAVERGEELGCGRVGIELALEVGWDLGGALPLISGLPAPVGFRRFDLGQPRRAHLPRLDQHFRLLAIDPRPAAARAPRREALKEMLVVEAALLAVDPAEAEGQLERLPIGDAGLGRTLLGDLQPDALAGGVVLL